MRRSGPGPLLTIPAVVDHMARVLPEHDAVIAGDRRLTFATLRTEVRQTAAAMIARGVEPADRVAIWLPNTWQWVVAALAAQYAGAVIVPLNTRFTVFEAADILARVGAPLLIAAADLPGHGGVADLDLSELPALRHTVLVGDAHDGGDRLVDWDSFAESSEAGLRQADARAADVRPDDASDIFFTSGTTGRSKGVLCLHRQSLSATAAVWEATGGLRSDDRYLCFNPFFHTFGYRFGLVACLQSGATLVAEPAFDPERALARIDANRITVFPGPPVMHRLLLDHPDRGDYNLGSLRLVVTGSTSLPAVLIERMQRELGVDVVTGYGLTEASGYGTTCRIGDDPDTVATTCGRPIPGLELRIDAPDGDGCGEVLLRGPHVMRAYLDDVQATASAVDEHGWLHTGDLGRCDDSGNLRISGRIKDMYICGGENVSPAEVEQELARLDGVSEAAVIGVRHPELGEVGRAFIVANPDVHLDENAVLAHCRRRLADFKTPRSAVFVSALPRNAGGKVLKDLLREHPAEAPVPAGVGGPAQGYLENWIAEAWQVLLGIERPGRGDRFTDLGGDSVSAAQFCALLSGRFDIPLSIDRFAGRQTIADVVAVLAPGAGADGESVVTLRADGAGPVCLITPGIGGHAWGYSRLAAALPGPCDVLAISPINISRHAGGRIRAAIRANALAALSDPAISRRPLVLVGYSFGALMAADLAAWLGRDSVTVSELLLLDPVPLDADPPRRSARARYSELRNQVRSLLRAPRRAVLSPAAQTLEDDIVRVADLLMKSYLDGRTRPPSVPIACLRSRETLSRHGAARTVFGVRMADIETTITDLGHSEMIRSVGGVTELAQWIGHRLAALGDCGYPNRSDVPGVSVSIRPRHSISIGG